MVIFLFCAFFLHLFSTKINDQYIKCYLSTQNVDKIGTGLIAMPPVDIVYIASVTMSTEIATTDVKMDMRETYAEKVCYIFLMKIRAFCTLITCLIYYIFY